ncbi:hypothetical protein ACRN94_00965 [Shewanella baltica]|uniref:hypothetical protein n=1 Tax=Shewanella baltica TaxID=62322 RepID=UPI0001DB83D1|nr:hypothetical protein [Shewanella baltica]ADT92877.1 hypothetical protein Sbal678_0693 [Shewanella baltica OS678]EHC06037.1 hypothetical protein Sbal625DRAFT_2628 [Shewanella baltica OS625]MCS6160334.1 hypothetical protein [Shewanella baltica]
MDMQEALEQLKIVIRTVIHDRKSRQLPLNGKGFHFASFKDIASRLDFLSPEAVRELCKQVLRDPEFVPVGHWGWGNFVDAGIALKKHTR